MRAERGAFRRRLTHAMPRWFGASAAAGRALLAGVRYFGWPLLAGLLLALLLVERHPEWVGLSGPQMPALPLATLEGPVSYSRAVDRAAPAVANLYTTKVVSKPDHPLYQAPLLRHVFGDSLLRQPRLESSPGSAVIMSAGGYLRTKKHLTTG